MKIASKLSAWIVGVSLCCAIAVAKVPPKVLKVKIEGTELDRAMLLQKLNRNGADHRMKFELVEADYDYRIVFATGQGTTQTTYGEMNTSGASADVFDSNGTELFSFERKGRWTDKGATDEVAYEIIKRIRQLNKLTGTGAKKQPTTAPHATEGSVDQQSGDGQGGRNGPSPEPQQIEAGQTPDQVKAALGQPDKMVNLGAKQIWVYKDLKVTFLNGKVSDVE
jgi:hypothetical protein